jgi:hypothetical protein
VLLITSPKLPDLPALDIDTSRGKRTTQLDLTQAPQNDCLKELVKDADVFLQAYRPGGLQEKGFGPQELAKVRPGIVCANLTAYGWEGPWKHKRGVIPFQLLLLYFLTMRSLVRLARADCYRLQLGGG